ncbi:Hypothetical protein ADU72_0691 [Pediococcus damnosus]|uniref:Uncharacterized protein n=1 Tax=Pediococcus damnosus TaxID=51663 RepID=A0AAC9FJJ0_9LACO|nr:Hypothetical protein ADU70_1961 [Pediococcus damnosus]AMV66636.1 Hypothetical protein ADU72_0691 [Pediococcus damnosus]
MSNFFIVYRNANKTTASRNATPRNAAETASQRLAPFMSIRNLNKTLNAKIRINVFSMDE